MLIGQASELPIRVIENIRDNVEKHSNQIDDESLIEIEMAGHDPKYSTDESDCRRREIQSRKRLRQAKADSPIKEKIDNSFELARFVGRIDLRWRFCTSFRDCAEIVSHFDLIAIQEVNENLADFQMLMELLGSWWEYLVTDVTPGSAGNQERIALKALRGDFENVSEGEADQETRIERAMKAAS